MNDSHFYYKVVRNLFFVARNKTLSGPSYYLNFIAKVFKLAANHPAIFIKRSTEAVFKKPKSLIDVFSRRYLLQDWTPQSVRLKRTNREYYQWIEKVETPALNVDKQRHEVKKFKKKPLISLITPVFDPPLKVHKELIDSVLAQSYDNFELMLYNFGKNQAIRELLDKYAENDSRITVRHDLPNQGISNNSNLCLAEARGEFVGLLDHDDALEPNALFECVKAINDTGADFVYTDKDMMTEEGRRFDPTFKPEWSPEMELCGNYLTHFDIMRTSLVKDLGGWDADTDGAQDWDLFWRIAERTDKIAHVPKIVYHWRTVEGSTSNRITAKPYVLKGQIRTIEKHLNNVDWQAVPYHDWTGQLYVDWIAKPQKTVVALHLVFKGFGDTHVHALKKLIKEIKKQLDYSCVSKIIIFCLEKEASPKNRAKIDSLPGLEVQEYKPGDFLTTFLTSLQKESCENIIYVSDSISKISKDSGRTPWISQLNGWLSTGQIGLAGGLTHAPDGRVVDCGSFFDNNSQRFFKFYFGTGHRSGYIGHLQWTRNFVLPSERLFGFKKELVDNLANNKGLEPKSLRDDELPKLLAIENFALGWRAVYDPSVTNLDRAPFHLLLPESEELGKFLAGRGRELLAKGDPNYNPNLNYRSGDPKPALQSRQGTLGEPVKYELAAADFVLLG